MSGPVVEVLDAGPVYDAVKDALSTDVDGIPWLDSEGPKNPQTAAPYGVFWVSPGAVGGYPYDPGAQLNGTVTLHGVGTSARQAFDVATIGRDRLLAGDVDVEGRRLSITPDEAPPPYPERDTSTVNSVFVQALVFDWQLD